MEDIFIFKIALAVIITMITTLTASTIASRLLIRHDFPFVKRKIILTLIKFSAVPIVLSVIGQLNFDLSVVMNLASKLPKSLEYSVLKLINFALSFIFSPIPLVITGLVLSCILMLCFSEKVGEKISSPAIKFLFFTVISLGLYIPYIVISYLYEPKSSQKLNQGRTIFIDPKRGEKILSKLSLASKNKGIKIHPNIYLPMSQENKHILICGSIGSGKTTALMYPIIRQIMERGDRLLNYCRKGDYVQALKGEEGVIVLSPFYKGSWGWDVGKDINTEILCEEFSSDLIPIAKDNKSPEWPEAARDLLNGVLMMLQATKGEKWGFLDLKEILHSKSSVIKACELFNPAALQTIGSENDKQTAGVFMALRTATRKIGYLAKAEKEWDKKISIAEWVKNENHNNRTIIIAGNPRYKSLDDFFTVQLFNLFYAEILALEDSHSRRIWSLNDEQGNQPKIARQTNAMTEARSKGLRVVSAIQGVGQIKEQQGPELAKVWLNCYNTKLTGKIKDKDEAKHAAEEFGGTNRLDKTSVSYGEDYERVTKSKDVRDSAALLDTHFTTLPDASTKEGAYFWFQTSDWPSAKLNFPVKPLPKSYSQRMPMDWTGSQAGEDSHSIIPEIKKEISDIFNSVTSQNLEEVLT